MAPPQHPKAWEGRGAEYVATPGLHLKCINPKRILSLSTPCLRRHPPNFTPFRVSRNSHFSGSIYMCDWRHMFQKFVSGSMRRGFLEGSQSIDFLDHAFWPARPTSKPWEISQSLGEQSPGGPPGALLTAMG